MKLTIGVAGSAAGNITNNLNKKAFVLGQEIAKLKAILITGGCPGLPFEAAKGAKNKGGFVVGISPCENKKDHIKRYHSFIGKKEYSLSYFDLIIYTGFGLKGRNVIFVRSCCGLITIGGRTGTLNEFTVAYDENRPIGVLKPGGISEVLPKIISISQKGENKVIFETDSKKLAQKLVKIVKNSFKP